MSDYFALCTRVCQKPEPRVVQQVCQSSPLGLPFQQHGFCQQHVVPWQTAALVKRQVVDAAAPCGWTSKRATKCIANSPRKCCRRGLFHQLFCRSTQPDAFDVVADCQRQAAGVAAASGTGGSHASMALIRAASGGSNWPRACSTSAWGRWSRSACSTASA